MGKLEGVGEDGKTELWEKAAFSEIRDFEISKARGDGDVREFEISKRAGDGDALIRDTIPRALIFGNHELVHGHSLHVLLDDGFHLPFEEVEGVGRDCGEDILMQ